MNELELRAEYEGRNVLTECYEDTLDRLTKCLENGGKGTKEHRELSNKLSAIADLALVG